MLRLTVSTEEYLMIGDNVKIVFLGGTKNHLKIMVDAPKDVNVVRSTVMENKIKDPVERAKLPVYHAEPEVPEKYRKKKRPNIYIAHGNVGEGGKARGGHLSRTQESFNRTLEPEQAPKPEGPAK